MCFVFISVVHQVLRNPRNISGYALSDGEVVERLWSYLRRFSAMTKEMRPAHRTDVLTHALLHYGRCASENIGWLTYAIEYVLKRQYCTQAFYSVNVWIGQTAYCQRQRRICRPYKMDLQVVFTMCLCMQHLPILVLVILKLKQVTARFKIPPFCTLFYVAYTTME